MSDRDPTSPWGEPASAGGGPYRSSVTRSAGAGAQTAVRSGSTPSASRAAAASTLAARRPSVRQRRAMRRRAQLVERTIMVRLIPRTGIFARIRAVFALAVIAATIGVALAAALSVAVWGIASAIHHAVNN